MPAHRGLPACSCLAEWLPLFERMIGREPRWFQLVGDAKASAGFHKGGGSADCVPLTEDELRIARNMGAAAWNRWWTNNFHAHLRLNGCPHNSVAQPQVTDLNAGRDGTGPLWDNAGVPDNGPRSGVKWPLRTWREGIEWAEARLTEDDMALSDEALTAIRKVVREEIDRNNKNVTTPRWHVLRRALANILRGDKANTAKIIAELDALKD